MNEKLTRRTQAPIPELGCVVKGLTMWIEDVSNLGGDVKKTT